MSADQTAYYRKLATERRKAYREARDRYRAEMLAKFRADNKRAALDYSKDRKEEARLGDIRAQRLAHIRSVQKSTQLAVRQLKAQTAEAARRLRALAAVEIALLRAEAEVQLLSEHADPRYAIADRDRLRAQYDREHEVVIDALARAARDRKNAPADFAAYLVWRQAHRGVAIPVGHPWLAYSLFGF